MPQVIKRVVDAVGWDGTIAGEAVDLHSESVAPRLRHARVHPLAQDRRALRRRRRRRRDARQHPRPPPSAASKSSPKTSAWPSRSPTTSSTSPATPSTSAKTSAKTRDRLTFVKLAGVDGAKKLSDELVDTSLSSISNLGPAAAAPARPRHDRPRPNLSKLLRLSRCRGDPLSPLPALRVNRALPNPGLTFALRR